MKLTAKKLKQLISEAIKEKQSETVLLEEPTIDEMATSQSVMDRINVGARPDNPNRLAKEFIIMSSDRGERSDQENKSIYKKDFLGDLKKMGLQYSEQQGSWVETDEETGEKRRVTEHSVIAYKEARPDKEQTDKALFQIGMELSKKYQQEAFIYGRMIEDPKGQPEREIKAYDADGNYQSWGGPWQSAEQVPEDEEFWSRVRGGKAYQLKEHKDYIEVEAPNSFIEAMKKAQEHKGKKIRFVRRKS